MSAPQISTAWLGITAALLLAGCGGDMASAPGNDAEGAARAACTRDVRAFTGNSDVVVSRSEFSEAGTLVTLTVGGTGTWQCIAYADGSTAGIMSLTDEGSL